MQKQLTAVINFMNGLKNFSTIDKEVDASFRGRFNLDKVEENAAVILELQGLDGIISSDGDGNFSATQPLSGTRVYYVSDSNGGIINRKLTFTDGILTSQT